MKPRFTHWSYDLRTHETRQATNKLLELVDEGLLNPRDILVMALRWMSEDDVKEMCKANEIDLEEIEIDEEYHDYSEDELCKMGCFDNLNEDGEEY